MNKIWNKLGTLTLIMTLVVPMMSGCGVGSSNSASNSASNSVTDDANTIRISVATSTAEDLMEALEEKFPEINFDIDYYSGSGTSYYMMNRLKNHDAGDIFYYTTQVTDDIAEEYLVDLSGFSFVGNFDSAILQTLDVDGSIYQVPGPVAPKFIIYNKTLFEENGWQIPSNFEELVAVSAQIAEEQPEIVPLGVGILSEGWLLNLSILLSQCGYLSTPAGKEAEDAFLSGEGSMADVLGDGLSQMAELIDAGAFGNYQFDEEWDFTAGIMGNRQAAMYCVMRNAQEAYPLLEGVTDTETYGEYCTDEFGVLPFYGIEDGQEGIGLTLITCWGLNKELEEEGNEEKLENALRVMEFMASDEGQQLMIASDGFVSCSKNTSIPEPYESLWKLKDSGQASFYLYSGYDGLATPVGEVIRDAIRVKTSEGMVEKAVDAGDAAVDSLASTGTTESFGTAAENFTEEETVQLGRETLLATGYGDFVLTTTDGEINRVVNKSGYTGILYEGEIPGNGIRSICGYMYNTAVTVPMTGAEVKEFLNEGKLMTDQTTGNTAVFEYGWAGIDVEFDKEGMVSSVRFNGEELSDTETYQVVFTSGDYTDEFAENHEIIDSEVTIYDIYVDYLAKNSPVAPPEATR